MAVLEGNLSRIILIAVFVIFLFIGIAFYKKSKRHEEISGKKKTKEEKKIEKEQKKEKRLNNKASSLNVKIIRNLHREKRAIIAEDKEEKVQYILAEKSEEASKLLLETFDSWYFYGRKRGEGYVPENFNENISTYGRRADFLAEQTIRRTDFIESSLEKEKKEIKKEQKKLTKQQKEEEKEETKIRKEIKGEKKSMKKEEKIGEVKELSDTEKELKITKKEKIEEKQVAELMEEQIVDISSQKMGVDDCISKIDGIKAAYGELKVLSSNLKVMEAGKETPDPERKGAFKNINFKVNDLQKLYSNLIYLIRNKNKFAINRYRTIEAEGKLKHIEGALEKFDKHVIKGVIKEEEQEEKR